jgi:hypothetical protein
MRRYYAALATAVAATQPTTPTTPPAAYKGLIQLCDSKLSQLSIDANNRLISISDVSNRANPLLALGGGNGPAVLTDAQGGVTLSFLSDSKPLTCVFDPGEVPVACTIAMLYRVPNYPGDYTSPWYFSPTRQREEARRPFIYLSSWYTLAYDGGGYNNYGPCQQKWQILILARNPVTGVDTWYHTDNGLKTQKTNTYQPMTGALIGNDLPGNFDLKTILVANYPYSDTEILALKSDLETRHKLTL